MVCARCNTENSGSARYCNACGSSLPCLCARCGVSLTPGARFCEGCGSPVATAPGQPEKPLGSPLTPQAPKEFDSPAPAAAEFRQTTTETDTAKVPTDQPRRIPAPAGPNIHS